MTTDQIQQVYDNLRTTVKLPVEMINNIELVIKIMTLLRAPGGCPWDQAQTHETLLKNLLEECYEYIDTVNSDDDGKMREELGDLFMQIVFQAEVAAERGAFHLGDVARELADKLVRRHPHVFWDQSAGNQDEALASWNDAKRKENNDSFDPNGVPRSMPALLRAKKVQEKAGRVGFEWEQVNGAMDKLEEELEEFKTAVKSGNNDLAGEELGDLLFAVVNVSRYLKLCPEVSLTSSTDKFINRFSYVKKSVAERGKTMHESTLEEMDVFWEEAKRMEK